LSRPISVILGVNESIETKRSFVDTQNGCGVRFSIMHCMKLSVHKIRSCVMNCVAEFENGACLIRMEMQLLVAVRDDYADTPVFRASPTSGFIVDVSNRAPSSFSSSTVIKCPVPI
jgi:hypothetical protein